MTIIRLALKHFHKNIHIDLSCVIENFAKNKRKIEFIIKLTNMYHKIIGSY